MARGGGIERLFPLDSTRGWQFAGRVKGPAGCAAYATGRAGVAPERPPGGFQFGPSRARRIWRIKINKQREQFVPSLQLAVCGANVELVQRWPRFALCCPRDALTRDLCLLLLALASPPGPAQDHKLRLAGQLFARKRAARVPRVLRSRLGEREPPAPLRAVIIMKTLKSTVRAGRTRNCPSHHLDVFGRFPTGQPWAGSRRFGSRVTRAKV
ncbi:Hypothetical predicted protein [Olea europaea subsp. europaea]|uniref:Uncharacterized protein n=1 Tax=Olea europaea subsp. europaea TaxID=158383 RepID=A0A8S0UNF7_OLEEU|nr:Hypothetical predicted protein [Olea europaea subsp. europaea]